MPTSKPLLNHNLQYMILMYDLLPNGRHELQIGFTQLRCGQHLPKVPIGYKLIDQWVGQRVEGRYYWYSENKRFEFEQLDDAMLVKLTFNPLTFMDELGETDA